MDKLVVMKFHTNNANRWFSYHKKKLLSFSIHKVILTCLRGPIFPVMVYNAEPNTLSQMLTYLSFRIRYSCYKSTFSTFRIHVNPRLPPPLNFENIPDRRHHGVATAGDHTSIPSESVEQRSLCKSQSWSVPQSPVVGCDQLPWWMSERLSMLPLMHILCQT